MTRDQLLSELLEDGQYGIAADLLLDAGMDLEAEYVRGEGCLPPAGWPGGGPHGGRGEVYSTLYSGQAAHRGSLRRRTVLTAGTPETHDVTASWSGHDVAGVSSGAGFGFQTGSGFCGGFAHGNEVNPIATRSGGFLVSGRGDGDGSGLS